MMTRYHAFNEWLANLLTDSLGTMECAYVFVVLAFLDLPAALVVGGLGFWGWLSTIFIQLVMLAVIVFAGKINGSKESAKLAGQSEEQHQELLDLIQAQHTIVQNQTIELGELKELLELLHTKFGTTCPS